MTRLTPDSGVILSCSNGPLPKWLEPRAYFSRDRHEFALKREDALEYLEWCQREGLRVLGFDIWAAADPSPSVLEGEEGFEGNARECHEAISSRDFSSLSQASAAEPVFNIWVDLDDEAGSA